MPLQNKINPVCLYSPLANSACKGTPSNPERHNVISGPNIKNKRLRPFVTVISGGNFPLPGVFFFFWKSFLNMFHGSHGSFVLFLEFYTHFSWGGGSFLGGAHGGFIHFLGCHYKLAFKKRFWVLTGEYTSLPSTDGMVHWGAIYFCIGLGTLAENTHTQNLDVQIMP